MPASVTVDSDRERIVHIYASDPRTRASSRGSVSVRSPASSGASRSSDESWSDVGYDDGIVPSDSASRQPRSRRHTVEVPRPPSRHSRTVDEREDSRPRRHTAHRHHSDRREVRHERSHSRRVPSDESSGSVASPDDFPYPSHHGMPRAPYPPQQSGYRHVPAQGHGGYPPSMAPAPYHDPYNPQALVQMPRHDAFAHPGQQNPFAAGAHSNPFSPMSTAESSNYFGSDPMAQQFRGPPRPHSYYPGMGSELMPAYSHGYPAHGYPPHMPYPYMHPPSQGGSPAPREEETKAEIEALKVLMTQQMAKHAEETAKSIADSKPKPKIIDPELEGQRELLKRLQEDLIAQQKALQAEREAEILAKQAAKLKEEEDKKRKAEISEASKKAKDEAEKKATEAAAKAKEEADKKLAEAQKAKEESEKAKKALEEEIKKSQPEPDSLKKPIRFKDAVGRKFSFPWHLCKTWKGMEGLIKQAFAHVDLIGNHVQKGHYDLTGPDGEIILPQVWDTMVQPDWEITMHLWPMPEEEMPKKDKLAMDAHALNDPFMNLGLNDLGFGLGPPPGASKGAKSGKGKGKAKKSMSNDMIMVPPLGPGPGPGPGPGLGPMGDPFANLGNVMNPGITVMPDEKKLKRTKTKSKSAAISPWQAWMMGTKPPAKKK